MAADLSKMLKSIIFLAPVHFFFAQENNKGRHGQNNFNANRLLKYLIQP
jgi:hypothetical protein